MTFVDTSAWIEFLRRQGPAEIKEIVARCLRTRQAAITGPILTELIAGARREDEIALVQDVSSLCEHMPFLDDWWAQAGRIKRSLMRKGMAVPIMDVLIAVAARESKMPVLTTDKDFETLRKHAMPDLQVECHA